MEPYNKKAMTYGLMIGFILSAILLVIIIHGVITGWLVPLLDSLFAWVNGTLLVLIGIKDPLPSAYDCQPRFLKTAFGSNGDVLMDELGMNEEEKLQATFTLCNNECRISNTNLGSFKVGDRSDDANNEFSVTNPYVANNPSEPWVRENYYLKSKDLTKLEEHRDLYWSFIQTFSDTELMQIKEFYDKRFTKRVLFYASGANGEIPSFLVWQNGYFIIYLEPVGVDQLQSHLKIAYEFLDVYPERILYKGTDVDRAISIFRQRVYQDFGDAKVFYRISREAFVPDGSGDRSIIIENVNTLQTIDGFVGNHCLLGSSDELDCDEEFVNLRKELLAYQNTFTQEVQPSQLEIDDLKNVVDGKTLSHLGTSYTLKVLEDGSFPSIGFMNGEVEEYSLAFYSDSLSSAVHKVEQRNFPSSVYLGFTEDPLRDDYLPLKFYQGEYPVSSAPQDYMLLQEDFDHFFRVRKIKDFLFQTCRGGASYGLA